MGRELLIACRLSRVPCTRRHVQPRRAAVRPVSVYDRKLQATALPVAFDFTGSSR